MKNSMVFQGKKMKKIDFLCVGIAKCGTTTLDSIIRQHKEVELPVIKEPQFFIWKDNYSAPYSVLMQRFFTNDAGKKRGIIDPSLANVSPKLIRQYFGENIKVIIVIRNPVSALFSSFKMGLLLGYFRKVYLGCKSSDASSLFHKYLYEYGVSAFDKRYQYSQYLVELMNTFDKENIKIIVFEKMIKETEKYIREVLDFIGVDKDVDYIDFENWENEGNRISKNYTCALINSMWVSIYHKTRTTPKINWIVHLFGEHIFKMTTKNCDDKIGRHDKRYCERYYSSEIRKVEKLINEDLSDVWF